MIPEYIAYSGAGLIVGGLIREFIITAEGLSVMPGSYSPGDVDFFGHYIPPYSFDGTDIIRVTGDGRHIGHSRIHIGSANGVAYCLILLDHGFVALKIGIQALRIPCIRHLPAPHIQEIPRQIQVSDIACCAVELYQADLNLLMTRHPILPARTEGGGDQVGIFNGDVQKGAFAGSLKMGYGRFVHMPNIVELMTLVEKGPAFGSRRPCRFGWVDGTGSVEVAVGLLGTSNYSDKPVQIGVELRIRMHGQGKGGAFHDLEHVGIIETYALMATRLQSGRDLEIFNPSGFLAFLKAERYGYCAVGLDALCPEIIANGDLGEGHRSDRIVPDGGAFLGENRK